jgi:Spy/CpxP family protein refolding chaperone
MKISTIGALLAGTLLSMAINAECVYPKPPAAAPDGLTATREEMLEAMRAVKDYNERVTAYLECLETETNERIAAAGTDATPEQIAQIKAIYTKRHDAAVQELQSHADRFNEQVKVFKARDKKS